MFPSFPVLVWRPVLAFRVAGATRVPLAGRTHDIGPAGGDALEGGDWSPASLQSLVPDTRII
jgi:hypothetical protein